MDGVLAREMYKEHILDLYKYPHNFGKLEGASHSYRSYNPLCGDDITLQLIITKGKVEGVKFLGRGCAISMASASLLTDEIKGKTIEDVQSVTQEDILEMLEIPIGPVRLKCALLCWEALQEAVKFGEKVSL